MKRKPRAPMQDESLDGYLAYRAEHIGLPDISEIAELAGNQRASNVRTSRCDGDLSLVGELLGMTASTLTGMSSPLVEPGRRALCGASVHVRQLERPRRMFAPDALSAGPFHRALWDLKAFPFDDGTGQLLGHRCPDPACDRSQGWNHTRGIDRCDLCGMSLAEGVHGHVPSEDLLDLRLGLGLVHPDHERRATSVALLPDELRRIGGGELLDFLVALAGTVDPTVVSNMHNWTIRRDAPPAAVCMAVARAWPLLADWPHAFERRSLDLAISTPRGRGDGNGGATARLLNMDRRKLIPADLAELIRTERTKLEKTSRAAVRANEGSKLRGLRASDIARARRSGELTMVATFRRGLFIPMLDRASTEALSARFVRTQRLMHAAAAIGCGTLGVDQLHALGLLGDDAMPNPITGHEARISRAALSDFRRRLAAASSSPDPDWVRLVDVLRAYGGGAKPIGPLAAAMLAGGMPFHLPDDGGPTFRRVVIDRGAIPRILGLRFDRDHHRSRPLVDHVSKLEASREMNLLLKHGGGELAQWPNRGTTATVPVDWLLATMQAGISLREIAARTGRHGNGLRRGMDRLGLVPISANLFDRVAWEASPVAAAWPPPKADASSAISDPAQRRKDVTA